jgi:hypothetical protein
VQRADVNVAGQPVAVDGQLASLTEEKCQVDLPQALPVPVVAILEIFVQLPVGGDGGDVITEVIVFQDLFSPPLEEGLLTVNS